MEKFPPLVRNMTVAAALTSAGCGLDQRPVTTKVSVDSDQYQIEDVHAREKRYDLLLKRIRVGDATPTPNEYESRNGLAAERIITCAKDVGVHPIKCDQVHVHVQERTGNQWDPVTFENGKSFEAKPNSLSYVKHLHDHCCHFDRAK